MQFTPGDVLLALTIAGGFGLNMMFFGRKLGDFSRFMIEITGRVDRFERTTETRFGELTKKLDDGIDIMLARRTPPHHL